jgi:enamine deaminase RidA (YjgF/YER057c/UK114 family)
MSDIDRKHSNARMSKIVRYGGLVFLCGQTSSGSAVADIDGQTRESLSRIDALLADAGSDRGRLLSVTIHLKSMADFAKMNACWESWLAGVAPPARTTVQAALASEDLLVEFTVTAAAS